jgi:hypothetical protein
MIMIMIAPPLRACCTLAVAASCAVALALPASAQSYQDERAAAELLTDAEFQCTKGRHGKAVTQYRVLSRKYPDTMAAEIAAERILPTAYIGWTDLLRQGPSSNRVDVVIVGDGYKLDQQSAFDDIAKTVPRLFEHNPTLEEYFAYHNFVRQNLVSADAGVDGLGRTFQTALGGYIRGTDQGHVGVDNSLVKQWLNELPEHDGLAIAYVKRGVLGTGGGGVATVGGRGDKTTIHEWGHAFAGLGDEYATSTGHRGVVNSRINVSATEDPERVPWAHWLDSKARGIGIYQGADGRDRGAWKPTNNCLMASADFFCPICREAMVLAIHEFVDPIDDALSAQVGETLAFDVTVLQPGSHKLDVHWWVMVGENAPRGVQVTRPPGVSRRERGPLPPSPDKPTAKSRPNNKGQHRFQLKTRDMAPGRYRIICRVRDDTEIAGDKEPWVLRDPAELLQSTRAWWLELAPAPRR